MIEFGKTLREAREAKGLTTNQLAEETRILHQIVEDLEHEDFHRISAPIYGRGFVKLYCEAVGLEPKPLVDEFMAILNGEREPAIRLKEVELPEETPAEPAPEPPKPAFIQPDLEPAPPPPPAPASSFTRPAEPPAHQYHPDYAQSVPTYGPSLNYGRLAVVAGGAILALVLIILGGRALYRATMTVSEEEKATPVEAKPVDAVSSPRSTKTNVPAKPVDAVSSPRSTKTNTPTKPATKRTPKTVPPLYID